LPTFSVADAQENVRQIKQDVIGKENSKIFTLNLTDKKDRADIFPNQKSSSDQAEDNVRPDRKARFNRYLKSIFGPVALAKNVAGSSFWADCRKTAYIGPETKFKVVHQENGKSKRNARPDNIPPLEQFIPLRDGDALILTKAQIPGRPARLGKKGEVLEPARISCTLPDVFDDVRAGENIFFDDGKIHGVIKSVSPDEILVEMPNLGSR
jgi:hypothetical protein